jgi:hypothetical protein
MDGITAVLREVGWEEVGSNVQLGRNARSKKPNVNRVRCCNKHTITGK